MLSTKAETANSIGMMANRGREMLLAGASNTAVLRGFRLGRRVGSSTIATLVFSEHTRDEARTDFYCLENWAT